MQISDKSNFSKHKKSHSDVFGYECQVCCKKFKANRYLKTHMKIHDKVPAFVCNECSQSFVSKNALKVHQLATHKKIKQRSGLWCDICFKVFRGVFKR